MAAIPKLVIPPGPGLFLELGSTAVLYRVGHEVHKIPLKFELDGCETEEIKQKRYEEADSRLLIEREALIYRRLGFHPSILKCLGASNGHLRFPYMEHKDLRQYLRNPVSEVNPKQRREWVKQAVEAVNFIHSMGVLHADISARNFLVASDLSLKLCDFAGSSLDDLPALVSEEVRYRKVSGVAIPFNTVATDAFALGSLIFEIITGTLPYDHVVEDTEVESRYRKMVFPSTEDLEFGCVIRKCWFGEYDKVDEILYDISP